ncbi:hypothetical protein NC652_005544 [Populus alba x Populus x berolinensis]|nr:hypothetical protein NC652_005544 [Populus alba x Populus x berolinensis]
MKFTCLHGAWALALYIRVPLKSAFQTVISHPEYAEHASLDVPIETGTLLFPLFLCCPPSPRLKPNQYSSARTHLSKPFSWPHVSLVAWKPNRFRGRTVVFGGNSNDHRPLINMHLVAHFSVFLSKAWLFEDAWLCIFISEKHSGRLKISEILAWCDANLQSSHGL